MPPLPRSALARIASLKPSRSPFTARRYATPAASSRSVGGQDDGSLILTAPAAQRKEEGVRLIKYAGKKKPITPVSMMTCGVRHTIKAHHEHLHDGRPLRDLTVPLRRSGGRNDTGQVVNRFVGGGHKRRLRVVDFMRNEEGDHEVVRIEYDPGRSAHIALVRKLGESSKGASSSRPQLASSPSGKVEVPFGTWGLGSYQKPPSTPTYELEKVRGGLSYILATEGLRAGDIVRSYRSGIPSDLVEGLTSVDTDPSSPQSVNPPGTSSSASSTTTSRGLGILRTRTIKAGNVLPLRLCPPGTIVHNISSTPHGKMILCRSAGTFGQIIAHGLEKKDLEEVAELDQNPESLTSKEKNGWALVKMKSGEVRKLHPECVATIGTVSNKEHQQEQIGKAGRSRWMGRRPRVRGVAMNACDHPHGGGRGKSKGNRHPMSVWGWLTRGKRTRRPKDKDGNKMVVTERPRGRATANARR